MEWLRINAREHAAQILQTVKLRAFDPRATEWQRMYQLADAFHTGHHHLDPTDKSRDGALISWLDRQRYLKGASLLAFVRIHELDQLGMIWDKHARSWDRGFAHARWRSRRPRSLTATRSAPGSDGSVGTPSSRPPRTRG
ncbi:helicase associated domain-containing protein [Kitasatospora sp. NPDC005748]|uniref:helicase associated domain-containing protein n=1 Tax=Kitasatospora sp. NPDC005748 TaxID=3157063 RepID=UPI0033F3AD57